MYLCQQFSIIAAHNGSMSFGISSRWFMNPTAPITCKYPRETVVNICIDHRMINKCDKMINGTSKGFNNTNK